jgi:hypothetical protein
MTQLLLVPLYQGIFQQSHKHEVRWHQVLVKSIQIARNSRVVQIPKDKSEEKYQI